MLRAPHLIIRTTIALSLLLVRPAFAQDSATAAIRGTVVDPHGLRIAGAGIAVVNAATGRRYSVTTDSEGRFALDLLPPGDYSARVVAQGMSPQITPPLHIDVGGAAELEFRLSIAGAQEKVTVSGDPQLVETQPSAVSTIL
ncbi:MAG: carboxypeptidase-like regulatory domain-containing protein, partial [Candidatus Sulfotelmatobacter sp.]